MEAGGDVLQAKLVDYSFNLLPEEGSTLAEAIRRTMLVQHPGARTVTPSMYPPTRMRPQAVAFEAKLAAAGSDPLVQLTIWAAASFERLRQILSGKGILCTLPLVQVRGHDWHVWFARDAAKTLDLHGPFLIGSTSTLFDTFKLVRSLRALGEWAAGPFKEWFETAISAMPS